MATDLPRRIPSIPGWEPLELLGQNGGIYYVARRLRDGECAVLGVWDRWAVHSRQVSLLTLLAGLDHPHIRRVFEVGKTDDGRVYVEARAMIAACESPELEKELVAGVEAWLEHLHPSNFRG